jgi:hypothetical protein
MVIEEISYLPLCLLLVIYRFGTRAIKNAELIFFPLQEHGDGTLGRKILPINLDR